MTTPNKYDDILECVCEVQAARRSQNRMPDHALIIADNIIGKLSPMCSRLDFYIALGELVEAGKIETGRTINDTYIRIKEESDELKDNEYVD